MDYMPKSNLFDDPANGGPLKIDSILSDCIFRIKLQVQRQTGQRLGVAAELLRGTIAPDAWRRFRRVRAAQYLLDGSSRHTGRARQVLFRRLVRSPCSIPDCGLKGGRWLLGACS